MCPQSRCELGAHPARNASDPYPRPLRGQGSPRQPVQTIQRAQSPGCMSGIPILSVQTGQRWGKTPGAKGATRGAGGLTAARGPCSPGRVRPPAPRPAAPPLTLRASQPRPFFGGTCCRGRAGQPCRECSEHPPSLGQPRPQAHGRWHPCGPAAFPPHRREWDGAPRRSQQRGRGRSRGRRGQRAGGVSSWAGSWGRLPAGHLLPLPYPRCAPRCSFCGPTAFTGSILAQVIYWADLLL